MKEKFFPLEPPENGKLIKILRILLGIACIAIAVFWIIFSIKSKRTDGTLLAASVFLVLFGIYQIMAGFGKTARYIKTGRDRIEFKQHSALPAVELLSADIESIDLYPLSIQFHLKNRKKKIMRFGLSYAEIIDPVKQEIMAFAELNKIPLEIVEEEL